MLETCTKRQIFVSLIVCYISVNLSLIIYLLYHILYISSLYKRIHLNFPSRTFFSLGNFSYFLLDRLSPDGFFYSNKDIFKVKFKEALRLLLPFSTAPISRTIIAKRVTSVLRIATLWQIPNFLLGLLRSDDEKEEEIKCSY